MVILFVLAAVSPGTALLGATPPGGTLQGHGRSNLPRAPGKGVDLIKDKNFDEATMVPTAPMDKELVVMRRSIEEDIEIAMNPRQGIAVREDGERRELIFLLIGGLLLTIFGFYGAFAATIFSITALLSGAIIASVGLIGLIVVCVGSGYLGYQMTLWYEQCNAEINCIWPEDCSKGCKYGYYDAEKEKCCKVRLTED